MTLPMTSFPNVNSILMEDKKGEPYLKVRKRKRGKKIDLFRIKKNNLSFYIIFVF